MTFLLSVDLPHLHKVLKDRTRTRILELLNERGPLTYVELLNKLEIAHTGNLNYHLKILGDLLSKDETTNGKYSLSEKGELAVALLGKFQSLANSKQTERKARLKKEYTISGVNLTVVPLVFHLLAPATFTIPLMFASYIIGYTLIVVNYFWLTGINSENPTTARIIGRFFAMLVFGDIVMAANFGLLLGIKFVFPFVNDYPSVIVLILGLLPGFLVGVKIGDEIGKRHDYRPLWWPLD
jgi:predicted transcriptional regulator